MGRFALWAVILTLAFAQCAAAQGAVFVVRHAERADAGTSGGSMMRDDPELSAAGRARAAVLAAMLRDAEIRAVYTTELRRTQQTAAPLVAAAGIGATTVPAADVAALVEKVKAQTGNVLIVGHSNTVPKILEALGAAADITIGPDEYDKLFVVVPGAPARLLRLRIP